MIVSPFLKWAGGKTQLLEDIVKNIPNDFIASNSKCYLEPFIGSGAVFLYLINQYKLDFSHINDINFDIYNTWYAIQNNVEDLIIELTKLKDKYLSLNEKDRTKYYYEVRDTYNLLSKNSSNSIIRACLTIFLNKTCFNGLYRLNSKGHFNVPQGKYSNPKIFCADNLLHISKLIKNTLITNLDYKECSNYLTKKTLIYLDPPYRPISKTSKFNSYYSSFDDNEQINLSKWFSNMSKNNWVLLSNSDPKNYDEHDNFFDNLYTGYFIKRLEAKRMINSVSTKRGKVKEILISNCEGTLV